MARCGCNSAPPAGCACGIATSDCISAAGSGSSGDPIVLTPVLHPSSDNMMQCTTGGLAAFVPGEIASLLTPSQIRVRRNFNTEVPHNTLVGIEFDLQSFRKDLIHSTTSDAWKIQFPSPGTYLLGATLHWDVNNDGRRGVRVTKNPTNKDADDGILIAQMQFGSAPPDGSATVHCGTLYHFETNDYIAVQAFHQAGVPLNVQSINDLSPVFYAIKLSEDF